MAQAGAAKAGMPDTAPVNIPVSPEAARLMQDAGRARRIGRLVSDMLHPSSPDADPLAALIAATRDEARASGLTDEAVDEALAEHNAGGVFDASTLAGALLRSGSVPERALLPARVREGICLSSAVERELRDVLAEPKPARYLLPGRVDRFFAMVTSSAPGRTDRRGAKDNKYLELALEAGASTTVASDSDLPVLDPFRGVAIITPAEYVRRHEPGSA